MPAACRLRLRLPSNFAIRDNRKVTLLNNKRHLSGFTSRHYTSANRAVSSTSNSSMAVDAVRGRHSFSTATSQSFSIVHKESPTLGASTLNTASFHSSPLSWFAADAEEAKSSDDATTTTTEEPASEDASTDESSSNEDKEQAATDIVYNISPPHPLSQASQDKVQAIFDKVLWLDMIEVHLLTQIVNEQMGISWKETEMRQKGGGFVQASSGGGGSAAEEPVEEKTIFDLKLVGFDAKAKIKVIKEVRAITGLGLKEAKEMVEGAPKVVQKELKLDKAEELKAQLEAVGAQVELV